MLRDPRSQYPGPGSSIELQGTPGTQQAMSAKPDCGETSYKGSGRLDGRKALLTGEIYGVTGGSGIA